MKINTRNQILGILLIVQTMLAIVLLFPGGDAGSRPRAALLPDFAIDQVNTIIVRDAQTELTLAKDPTGNWVLRSGGDYPVNNARVAQLLGSVTQLQANRLIAQNASSHNRLQVSDTSFARIIDFTTTAGNTTRLYLGSASGGNATHTRVQGQDTVYLTTGLSSFDVPTTPTSWVDPIYFSVTREDITRIQLQNANGTFDFVRQGDTWTITDLASGETFNVEGFNRILNGVTNIRMTAPIGTTEEERFGLASPSATITVTVQEPVAEATAEATDAAEVTPEGTVEPAFTEAVYTLVIGSAEVENSEFVIKASNSDYYVRISVPTAGLFRNLTRAEVVTPAPENTAEATPEATAVATVQPEATTVITPEATAEATVEATPETTAETTSEPSTAATPTPTRRP